MKLTQPLILSLALLALAACTKEGPFAAVEVKTESTQNPAELKELQRFAFGSCNKQYLPQPLWKQIIKDKAELFVWTGDVVYADTEDMGKLSQIYASQLAQAEYASFLATKTPVIGVWDDHDYGQNGGDESFAPRKKSQELFLNFIGETKQSPRRTQDGIQTSYEIGKGKTSSRFLLLDTHSHRTHPDGGKDSDLLGVEQWKWLEKELNKPFEGVVYLVSSIQVLPFEQDFEKWKNFPKSYDKLLGLLEKAPAKNIVIISGDRHFAELSKQTLGTKTIWEVTSSGMTHAYRNPDPKRNLNSLRVGPILDRLNYGFIENDGKNLHIQVKDINRSAIIDQRIPIL